MFQCCGEWCQYNMFSAKKNDPSSVYISCRCLFMQNVTWISKLLLTLLHSSSVQNASAAVYHHSLVNTILWVSEQMDNLNPVYMYTGVDETQLAMIVTERTGTGKRGKSNYM